MILTQRLVELLNHKTRDVRLAAVKHLGKFKGIELTFYQITINHYIKTKRVNYYNLKLLSNEIKHQCTFSLQ